MAGAGDLLGRVTEAVRAFDDEALAALSNRGVVKRAKKDLERVAPAATGESRDSLLFRVEDATVSIPATIRDATCSCPAGLGCRHVITALMFLRESAGAAAPLPSCAEEILAVDDAAFEKWASKAVLGRALDAVAGGLSVECEDGVPFVIRIPVMNATSRWLPGAGLDGMLCTCHAPGACEHKAAAVLGFQVARGVRRVEISPVAAEEPRGAPRTRAEILDSLGAVLAQIIALGLSRLSRAVEQRLRTLAVSAHGVDLPRLERLLRSLAEEVRLCVARDAHASAENLLAAAARAEALRCALARPKARHVGEHRSTYDRVGDIEIQGVGARRWQTRSGHEGVTVWFWDRSAKSWASWSSSRPVGTPGFDPSAAFRAPGPWVGGTTPGDAVGRRLRLSGAFRNRQGRLSGREGTRVMTTAPADPLDIPDIITRWRDLADRARRAFAGGLADRDERATAVLLKPTRWGAATFNALKQQSVRDVFDTDGRPVSLVVPFVPWTPGAVEAFESADGAAVRLVFGHLQLADGRISVEPATLLFDAGPRHLSLLTSAAPVPAASAPPAEEDDIEEESALPDGSGELGRFLQLAEATLSTIAESGASSPDDVPMLQDLAARASMRGIETLARAVTHAADALAECRAGRGGVGELAALPLLHALYVAHAAAGLEVVESAVASLA